jgi:hypothetical protein
VLSETKRREKGNISLESEKTKKQKLSWAKLLNRVFNIDLPPQIEFGI